MLWIGCHKTNQLRNRVQALHQLQKFHQRWIMWRFIEMESQNRLIRARQLLLKLKHKRFWSILAIKYMVWIWLLSCFIKKFNIKLTLFLSGSYHRSAHVKEMGAKEWKIFHPIDGDVTHSNSDPLAFTSTLSAIHLQYNVLYNKERNAFQTAAAVNSNKIHQYSRRSILSTSILSTISILSTFLYDHY